MLIFTGHRVDAPDRAKSRFPPRLVDAAGRAIGKAIDELSPAHCIASASRGGDILFLEACRARGIPSTIVLPFSPDEFERRSVAGVSEGDWVARYRSLIASTRPERLIVLNLVAEPDPYRACNLAILKRAQAASPSAPLLLALWDGEGGDGPGGSADMVERVRKAGGRAVIINPSALPK
ncbi:MAG: hypothetical protein U1E20_00805 [Methylocystis sp.]|uniref:hypothetical protein n=1 Tax=Methylocystis sp. TaxID=1911079 RepID=UPI003933E3F4